MEFPTIKASDKKKHKHIKIILMDFPAFIIYQYLKIYQCSIQYVV